MNAPLSRNADRPYESNARSAVAVDQENEVVKWIKLIFLIFLTYGIIVCMMYICIAIYQMNGTIFNSWEDSGGLLLGLFCFYVLVFAMAWFWGFKQRDRIKREVIEKEIQRQKAQDAKMELT